MLSTYITIRLALCKHNTCLQQTVGKHNSYILSGRRTQSTERHSKSLKSLTGQRQVENVRTRRECADTSDVEPNINNNNNSTLHTENILFPKKSLYRCIYYSIQCVII